jgi:hypothetical protein
MDLGSFTPIGNNGWTISVNSPTHRPSFQLNRTIAEKAEAYGFNFLLASCASSMTVSLASRTSAATSCSCCAVDEDQLAPQTRICLRRWTGSGLALGPGHGCVR